MAKYIGIKNCSIHGLPVEILPSWMRDIELNGFKANRLCPYREKGSWHYFHVDDNTERNCQVDYKIESLGENE